MDKQEKIVCAAVKFEQPVPGSSECIVIGIDYKDCESKDRFYELKANDDFLNLKWKKTIGYQNGFITNKNRFVDAKDAMEIAVKAKQVGLIEEKTVEIRMLMNAGFSTQAKISQKLLDDWINLFLQEELKPEDLY